MRSITKIVEDYLSKKGIHYLKEYNSIFFEVDGFVESYEMQFDVYEKDQYLILFAEFEETIPEGKKATASEYILRINNERIAGDFKMDMDEGYVRYKVINLLNPTALTYKMLDKIINGAVGVMDFRYPGFMAICYEEIDAVGAYKTA